MVQTIIFYHFLFTFIHEGNIKEENIGYAVFKKRISTDPAGLWGGGRGVTPPAPSPFNIRRMARCLKTTWTVSLLLRYLLYAFIIEADEGAEKVDMRKVEDGTMENSRRTEKERKNETEVSKD
jgi:hypothetical protein